MLDEITSKILYVPFNKDYTIDKTIRDLMTEEVFFEQCFVNINFNKERKKIRNMNEKEIDDSDDQLITFQEEKIEKMLQLRKFKNSLRNFNRWIDNDGTAVYCIKGDAGVGKTTYLHYLKYERRNQNIIWEIVDIQKATPIVKVLNKSIYILDFNNLNSKIISALLDNIFKLIFISDENGNFHAEIIAKNIANLNNCYRNNLQNDFPLDEVRVFFEDSKLFNLSAEEITINISLNLNLA